MSEGFEEFLRARRQYSERTRRLLIGVLAGACVALAASNVLLALKLTAGRASAVGDSRPRSAAVTPPPAGDFGAPPARANDPAARRSEPPAASPSIPASPERAPAVTLPKLSDAAPPADPAEQRRASPPAEPPRTARPVEPRGATSAAEPRGATTPAEPRAAEPPADARPRAEAPPPPVADRPALDLPPRPPAASTAPRRQATARANTSPAPPPPAALAAPTAREEATATWMLETYGRDAAEARAQAALAFYDAQSAEGRYWRRVLALIVSAR